MTVLRGDCVEVMAGMEPDSIDAIVCDPPYGLGFMGKAWDHAGMLSSVPPSGQAMDTPLSRFRTGKGPAAVAFDGRAFQSWCLSWATAALRVAKPGAYLLAFGGTRTVHRMTCALEDAGWVIRDMLIWGYASGFPKSRASLKPAYEPIVLARKPGASRDLRIDECRIGYASEADREQAKVPQPTSGFASPVFGGKPGRNGETFDPNIGRWPANLVLTDPILDGGWEGVVGGGEAGGGFGTRGAKGSPKVEGWGYEQTGETVGYGDSGTYSRFFMVPKAPRKERILSDGRRSPHPTQKPEALIRHLVNLVTPPGGICLDPFLGSGTLGVVCEGLGVQWVGIEREPEYADWAEDRIADGQPEWSAA